MAKKNVEVKTEVNSEFKEVVSTEEVKVEAEVISEEPKQEVKVNSYLTSNGNLRTDH